MPGEKGGAYRGIAEVGWRVRKGHLSHRPCSSGNWRTCHPSDFFSSTFLPGRRLWWWTTVQLHVTKHFASLRLAIKSLVATSVDPALLGGGG